MIKSINLRMVESRTVDVPQPVELTNSGRGYVAFGKDNAYPDALLNYYENCPTLESVINGLADYVSGAGIDINKTVDRNGGTLEELAKKITLDYIIFGAFAVNVLRSELHNITELVYLDVRRLRLDEEGEFAYYQKSWDKFTATKCRKYPLFSPTTTANSSVFYCKNPRSRGIYGRPMWASALKDVQTAIEISKFHLHSILNNFAPSAVVNFNNGTPSDEEQHRIEDLLNTKFSGSENASRMLLAFNDSKENAVSIARLTEDNFDKKYEALAKTVRENIFISFRGHPQLFGADPERQGFSSIEYLQSFALFKATVAAPIQREIEKAFAKIHPDFAFAFNEYQIDIPTDDTNHENPID